MKTAIERIIIKERIRKDITKISELAEDIKKNGLINPITVMALDGGAFQLLAGLRRIKAVQSLGLTEIEVTVVSPADAEAALRIEFSENEQREEFTYSEKMDYARLIEVIEKEKAKERMVAGKKSCEADPVPLGAQGQTGRTRDIVASKIGMGKTTYDRAKYIADNAPPEVIDQLDSGERTIRGTYDELRAKEKAAVMPADDDAVEIEADDNLPETESDAEANSKPRSVTPGKKIPSDTGAVKNDLYFQKLKAEEAEAIRKREEFDALPQEGKITELQRQIKELRARAVTAESDLETLKLNYGISIDHKDSIIESLKRQNAELSDALAEANKRIAELEAVNR